MDLRTVIKKSIYLILFGLMVATQPIQAQSPVFDQLKLRFNEQRVFHATFQHTYIDSYTDETSNSVGVVWIDKIAYKLESDDKIIVVDGVISKVYEGVRNRLIISDYDAEEDDFAPSRMLSGIDETYITSESKLPNGNTLVLLETDDDFATFVKVEIEVNKAMEPVKITAYDFADNLTITTFSDGKFEKVTSDTFKLTYPEDAEIVDMRY